MLIFDSRTHEPPRIVAAVEDACNRIVVAEDGRIFVGGQAEIIEMELGGGVIRKHVRHI